MRLLALLALLCAAILPAGCASAPEPQFNQPINSAYLLDAGDVLRITVFDQPDLTGSYAVNKAGEIDFPLVGNVYVRNLTTVGVAAVLTQQLGAKYLRNPDVAVEIAQYRPFFIMGEVTSGGQYAYVAGLTIQAAIATAGGFSPRAWKHSVVVTRKIGDVFVTRELRLTDPVMPGDTIRVRERFV